MNTPFEEAVEQITTEDQRYKPEAYEFVMDALSYTQKKFKRKKHVTGQELLKGTKEYLLKEFGPMTMTVLDHWGIKTTEDIGHIVFNLVSRRVLAKSEDDALDHFRDAFDFREEFEEGYRRKLHRKISRMRS